MLSEHKVFLKLWLPVAAEVSKVLNVTHLGKVRLSQGW